MHTLTITLSETNNHTRKNQYLINRMPNQDNKKRVKIIFQCTTFSFRAKLLFFSFLKSLCMLEF